MTKMYISPFFRQLLEMMNSRFFSLESQGFLFPLTRNLTAYSDTVLQKRKRIRKRMGISRHEKTGNKKTEGSLLGNLCFFYFRVQQTYLPLSRLLRGGVLGQVSDRINFMQNGQTTRPNSSWPDVYVPSDCAHIDPESF